MGNEVTGTYLCATTNELYDGSEVIDDSAFTEPQHLVCGDAFCGGNVQKVSDLSKEEFIGTKEHTTLLTKIHA